MLTLIRPHLHYFEFFTILHLLHLHTRVALHSCTEQTGPSIAAMTSG